MGSQDQHRDPIAAAAAELGIELDDSMQSCPGCENRELTGVHDPACVFRRHHDRRDKEV